MGIYSNILSNVPQPMHECTSGLGMPANRLHQLLESVLIAKLFDACEEHGMDVMPEGKNKDGETSTRIADILITDSNEDPVVIIEVCANETYTEAKKRVKEFFDTNPTSMKEGFIYNFNSNTWDYYRNGRRVDNSAFCKTVSKDLRRIIENSKIYAKYLKG